MEQSFDQFDKLEDILFSNLNNLDTFSDIFDFNQLNDTQLNSTEFDNIFQSNNELTNSINSNSVISSPSEYSQTDSLSPEIQADLNTTNSNEFNNSVTEPVTMVLPGSEQNGMLTTHEIVFKFDEQFDNFLADNKGDDNTFEKSSMEIVIDKDTCIDIEEDNDSDEDLERYSNVIF